MASGSLGVRGGFQGSSWKNYMETGPVRKRGPRNLVDIQGSLPLGLRIMHPNQQEIRQRGQQETCID